MTEWLAQGNSPNVGAGVGGWGGETPVKTQGKEGWEEVEPFLLGWDPKGQGYELDLGW